jgi:hypothetical protein
MKARLPQGGRAFCVAVPQFGMEIGNRMFHADGKPRNEGEQTGT